MNGSFCLGWLELQGPENMEWTMHAKQRNPSRIQAQEVAQKGPECDAKVRLTRPSNPLKTLGPELRLVCFIQRSNPIQTLLPRPRQRFRNGETPRCASPDLRTVEKHYSTRASATHAKRQPDEEKPNRAVDGK